MPASRAASTRCSIIGRFATGSITLGRWAVRGRMRFPSPAASTTHCIGTPHLHYLSSFPLPDTNSRLFQYLFCNRKSSSFGSDPDFGLSSTSSYEIPTIFPSNPYPVCRIFRTKSRYNFTCPLIRYRFPKDWVGWHSIEPLRYIATRCNLAEEGGCKGTVRA